ncbi:hypothetical protein [Saccharopolyspora taberi]|uniref:Uncharacterized protein n=1 Tax=Saccharopolyspora taberi TaxID=60895 RepID=A0ABN3V2B9_9PSEU
MRVRSLAVAMLAATGLALAGGATAYAEDWVLVHNSSTETISSTKTTQHHTQGELFRPAYYNLSTQPVRGR